MLSSKTKTGLSEAIPNKTTLATPRGKQVGKGVTKSNPDAPSTPQNSRLSLDRSMRFSDSKPAVERRSPRTTVTPDKQVKTPRGSELQAQLSQLQEDLKKSKEKLAFVEKEKEQALEELKEAKRLAEEATDKFGAAVVAQKRAEETTEIAKFRADELEQVGIEAAQKKEEEWKKELDTVRNQQAIDVAALLSTTEEVERLKHELAMTSDAKNQALSHADDATKIAEIHAEKVDLLSTELSRVKALLDSNQEMKNSESTELIKELHVEVDYLKRELEKAKTAHTEKAEAESVIEQLKQELEKTKVAQVSLAKAEDLIKELQLELERAKISEEKMAEMESLVESLKKEADRAKAMEPKIAEAEHVIEQLKQELEKAKVAEAKLSEAERLIEELRNETDILKEAESYASNMVEEWRLKAGHLESRVREANQLEKSASESLATFMDQLEEKSGLLEDADAEVALLREKVEGLEMSVARQRKDLEESKEHLATAKQEALEKTKMAESLISDLETVKEEKVQALNNEKLAASSVQTLLEEKSKLITELDASRDEEDKCKKAMESLTSALHEVSTELREAKEKLMSTQTELGDAEAQIENLKLVLEATNEKNEAFTNEAKQEINLLSDTIQQAKIEIEHSKSVWDQKELNFTSSLKKSDEESSQLKKEVDNLTALLKEAEGESQLRKKEVLELQENLKEVESEVLLLQGVVGEVKHESMVLKESLLDKENELQSIAQENEELHIREAAALDKVKELSRLHEEALAKEREEKEDELSNSEKDYDMLPSVVEFSEENGVGREETKFIAEIPSQPASESHTDRDLAEDLFESIGTKVENGNHKEEGKDSTVDVVEAKMWESCNIGEKDLMPEKETAPDSFEGEVDSKADDESFELNGLSSTENVENGGTSPTKQQPHKKKKPLLHKFGSLLKKGSTKTK